MYLLCTDLHLDDNSANEYRWGVFDELERACASHPVSEVFCLGDMTDRKVISARAPVFSVRLVDRIRSSWKRLRRRSTILMGNHDATVTGPPHFWEFLSEIEGVEYVTRPSARDDLLLLPFSPNPRAEWGSLRFRDFCAVFVHATRSGTIAENGHALVGQDLPRLPRSIKIYSGDVHIQQVVDNWIYVGAPHPVKYGDDYPCRFLLLDENTYEIVEEISVKTIGKRVVEISSLDDLRHVDIQRGDQVKIRASVVPGSIDWDSLETEIERWARKNGVEVSAIEGSYDLPAQSGQVSEELAPDDLLRKFAAEEGITEGLLNVGLELLQDVQ